MYVCMYFQSVFVKAGDSETREKHTVEEAIRESLGRAVWLTRNLIGKK